MNTSYNDSREQARIANYNAHSSVPYRYVLVLTNLCNLNCSFCFQDKKYNPGSLSLEKWRAVIDQIPENSHITLTGGEPLLFKDFSKLVESIPETITFNLITNGLLLDDEVVDFLLSRKNFRVLSISIDDVGNQSRDFKTSDWEKLLSNIDYLNHARSVTGSDVVFDVKSVVHSENQKYISQLANFVSSRLSADTHMIMFLKGSPIQHADVMFEYENIFYENDRYEDYDPGVLRAELEKINDMSNSGLKTRFYLHPKYTDFYEKFDAEAQISQLQLKSHDSERHSKCLSPWESVHINNDGNLFPCLAVSWGNVLEDSIKDIISSEVATKFKQEIDKCGTLAACKHCGYLKLKRT